eukprot:13863334-Alexandrium_andersonii.AAC.1
MLWRPAMADSGFKVRSHCHALAYNVGCGAKGGVAAARLYSAAGRYLQGGHLRTVANLRTAC